MEDSTCMDLMIDQEDYLIDDWESEYPLSTDQPGSELGSGSGSGLVSERPNKQIKVNDDKGIWTTSLSRSSSSPSSGLPTSNVIITFGCPDPKINEVETSLVFSTEGNKDQQGGCGNNGGRRGANMLKEHVLAERKRRQKLSVLVIGLSALLPGLKKSDKATVLEDAIKHMKQLQERVKMLEEERVMTKKLDQPVVLTKRSQVCLDRDDSSSHSSTFSAASPQSSSSLEEVSIFKPKMPMIEAQVSDRDLLIRVQCNKKKGCMIRILGSLEKFHLDVVSSFTIPFGTSTVVITILSKMNNNFSQSVEEVVDDIRLALA